MSKHFSFNAPGLEHELYRRSGSNPVPDVPPRRSSQRISSWPLLPKKVSARRWDGQRRITTDWDGLRRDAELWFVDGDCLVHLYSPGRSRRGPSLCISATELEARDFAALLESRSDPPSPRNGHSHTSSQSSDESFEYGPVEDLRRIYLAPPTDLCKEDIYTYSLGTRNFFAWMFGIPLVGSHLGQALIALLERMDVYRPDHARNEQDVLAYMDEQGYTDFRECADHALAALQFAERFEIDELWGDSFAHCTGMSISLSASKELEHVSHISKTLMSRAYHEMDLRLERAGQSLSNFFEDELSNSHLGLSNAARSHLDRFRSFLHTYHVGIHGYWPPARSAITNSAFAKSLYLSMYFEFRDLYLYLVDTESSTSIQDNIATGGICVLQNVKAFDHRHRYKSLPHPLPITPQTPKESKPMSFGSLTARRLGIGTRQSEFNRRVTTIRSLANATNKKIEFMSCPLVRDYMLFERTCTMEEDETEKISPVDCRKVRWLLIYAIFQTLISVTQAPKEVKDTQDVSYALSCQIPSTPPWKIGVFNLRDHIHDIGQTRTKIDLQPDINYAASMSTGSLVSSKSVKSTKSKRSSSPPSLRYKFSKARTPLIQAPTPKRPAFCEIIIHGYGNGLNPTNLEALDAVLSESDLTTGTALGQHESQAETDSHDGLISTPSSPCSSSRDSYAWSQGNSSSKESLTDMDHLSIKELPLKSRLRPNTAKSTDHIEAGMAGALEPVIEAEVPVPEPLDVTKATA